jgi:hypothetical protein
MKRNIIKVTAVLSLLVTISMLPGHAFSKRRSKKVSSENSVDTLGWSMNYLQKLLYSDGEWYVTDNTYRKSIKGVLNYAENDPIDTVVVEMNDLLLDNNLVFIFDRRPQDIRNRENVSGYTMPEELELQINDLASQIGDSLNESEIAIPEVLFDDIDSKAGIIPYDEPFALLSNKDGELPESLLDGIHSSFESIQLPDSVAPEYFDSVRAVIIDSCRLAYNDSKITSWRDSVISAYREDYIAGYIDSVNTDYRDSESRNFDILAYYNDSVVESVNDSIRLALKYLTISAESDSVLLKIGNLTGRQSEIWTANRQMNPIRVYLKNEQQDSLGVVLKNRGKGAIDVIIDDGVKFVRFSETQARQIKLQEEEIDRSIKKVEKQAPVISPWKMGGDLSLGLTQTALSNWTKGGENSMTILGIGKYQINYIKPILKWENSVEIRYGGYYSGSSEFSYIKNDDRMEFQSRFGYSAFKKWYYSGDFNFLTQMAKGYKIKGGTKNLISSYMSPGYLTFSLGLDYKPDENLSVFLAPLTSRTTIVKDTARIDQTSYGIDSLSTVLWEPGFIIKGKIKRQLHENILYDTRLELFSNYKAPFTQINFNWEQTLTMQVTQYISTQIMAHLLYDHNVDFPVLDAQGEPTGDTEKRWQFKELFTIGFKYKF